MVENESLFSLEVVVESLENVTVSCLIPAIAFRLLDFPTLVIRRQEKCSDDISSKSLVDIHGTYLIQSGKSCLFKMNKDVLLSNLQRTPLYVMLIDVSMSKAKLLASTTLCLTLCFEQVLKDIEINGLDVPAVHGSRGLFELYNLMGTSVAIVKLSYRIFSLGGTINGHVKTCEPITIKPGHSAQSGQPQEIKTKKLTGIPRFTEQEDNDLVHVPVFEKTTETPLLIKQLNVETQTDILCNEEPHSSEINKQQKAKRENINVTRPPPLYYNSKSTTFIPQPTTSNQKFVENYPRFLSKNILNKGSTCITKSHHTVSVQTAEYIEPKSVDEPSKQDSETRCVVELPLINALLQELSLAKQTMMGNVDRTEQPSAMHIQVHVPENAKKSLGTLGVKIHTQPSFSKTSVQEVKRVSPSNKRNLCKSKLPKPHSKGVLIQRQPLQFKKSVMKHHTTKTQKLREALNRKKRNENASAPCDIDFQERKARRNIIKGTVDSHNPKETQEFACQVELQHSNEQLNREQFGSGDAGNNNEENQKKLCKEIGVQVVCQDNMPSVRVAVQQSDLLQFSKEDLPLSGDNAPRTHSMGSDSKVVHGFPTDLSPIDTNMLNIRVPDYCKEQVTPSDEAEWSSHSRKSTSSSVFLAATKPVFSKYSPTPPPMTKNSRYTNHGSTVGVSLRESDVVDKPVIHLLRSTSAEDDLGDMNGCKEAQIIEDVLLQESDLVDEPAFHLSKSNSVDGNGSKEAQLTDVSQNESYYVDKPIYLSRSASVEHDYSDKFDSFESEHTIDSDSNKKI